MAWKLGIALCPDFSRRDAILAWMMLQVGGRLQSRHCIDIGICGACGGAMKVMPKALASLAGQALACIEDPVVTKQILDHLKHKAETTESKALPESRASPAGLHQGLFD